MNTNNKERMEKLDTECDCHILSSCLKSGMQRVEYSARDDSKESMWPTKSDGLTWLWIFQMALRCVITAQWEHLQHGARHLPPQDRREHQHTRTFCVFCLFFLVFFFLHHSKKKKKHISNSSFTLNRHVAKCCFFVFLFLNQQTKSLFHWHAPSDQ